MDKDTQEPSSSSKIHTIEPLKDFESNWAVDLAKRLEDYLLKICSGEITADNDDAHFSVNFAEAALLLQGSIQVYSRKVEYLYNLVLHALEFICQTRSQEHVESTSIQPEASSSCATHDEDDQFWVLDDIPVDAKNCLDNVTNKNTSVDHFIKPPTNLVVHEGECLDSTADGELETYLLATTNLYRDFILLDPCDEVAVDEYLKGDKSGEGQYGGYRGSSLISKAHRSFLSPASRRSGGTARKSSVKRGQGTSQASPGGGGGVLMPNHDFKAGPSNFGIPDNGDHGVELDDNHSQYGNLDESDDDDPWKPLNPHEPGNLKVKPFRKVKVRRCFGMTKHDNINSQFPIAKLHGTINPELTEIWETQLCVHNRQESQPPPLYEKLRKSLADGGTSPDTSIPLEDGDAENIFDDFDHPDFDQPDFDMPEMTYMDGVNSQPDNHDYFADKCDNVNAAVNEDPNSQASLEDLCCAHLDALLASIAENEKQTELAARVSTWKQRIENDLEVEDLRPGFDIHEYGETVLDKLSLEEGENVMSFTDVVKGKEKHDVARTFSALLQLVNDRKVDLNRSDSAGDSFCYTAVDPFYVRLLSHEKGPKKMQVQPTKKRRKSPVEKGCRKGEMDLLVRKPSLVSSPSSGCKSTPVLAQPNCKSSMKLGKSGVLRCTPDGKRRRRSRLVGSVDLSSARLHEISVEIHSEEQTLGNTGSSLAFQ